MITASQYHPRCMGRRITASHSKEEEEQQVLPAMDGGFSQDSWPVRRIKYDAKKHGTQSLTHWPHR